MLEIKIDNLTVEILHQDHRPSRRFVASNDIRVESCACPEAAYSGRGQFHTVFLRGRAVEKNNDPLLFHSLEDLLAATQALKEYCDHCGEMLNITMSRVYLK